MKRACVYVACLRLKMTSWYVARGWIAVCVRLIASSVTCSTNDVWLSRANREVRGGRIVHGDRQQHFVRSLLQ